MLQIVLAQGGECGLLDVREFRLSAGLKNSSASDLLDLSPGNQILDHLVEKGIHQPRSIADLQHLDRDPVGIFSVGMIEGVEHSFCASFKPLPQSPLPIRGRFDHTGLLKTVQAVRDIFSGHRSSTRQIGLLVDHQFFFLHDTGDERFRCTQSFHLSPHRLDNEFLARLEPPARSIEHFSTAESHHRGCLSQHEAISRSHDHRLIEPDLGQSLTSSLHRLAVDEVKATHRFHRSLEKTNRHPVHHRFGQPIESPQTHLHHLGGTEKARGSSNHAAVKVSVVHICEIDGRGVPGARLFHLNPVCLQTPDSPRRSRRQQLESVIELDLPADRHSGHDGAMTTRRKNSLDRQAKDSPLVTGGQFAYRRLDQLTQFIHAFTGLCTDRYHRSVFEKSSRDHLANLVLHQFNHICFDQIDLVDGDDAATDSEQ